MFYRYFSGPAEGIFSDLPGVHYSFRALFCFLNLQSLVIPVVSCGSDIDMSIPAFSRVRCAIDTLCLQARTCMTMSKAYGFRYVYLFP